MKCSPTLVSTHFVCSFNVCFFHFVLTGMRDDSAESSDYSNINPDSTGTNINTIHLSSRSFAFEFRFLLELYDISTIKYTRGISIYV